MNRVESARLLTLAALAALSACSGGGGGTTNTGEISTGSKFLVTKTEPVNGGRVYLNDPVRIDFTAPVDLESASLNTVSFQALNQLGEPDRKSVV